jgi:hypothetical protein
MISIYFGPVCERTSAFHIRIARNWGLRVFGQCVSALERNSLPSLRAAAARQPEQSIMTSPLQRWGLPLRSVARRRAPCKVGWNCDLPVVHASDTHHRLITPTLNFSSIFPIPRRQCRTIWEFKFLKLNNPPSVCKSDWTRTMPVLVSITFLKCILQIKLKILYLL